MKRILFTTLFVLCGSFIISCEKEQNSNSVKSSSTEGQMWKREKIECMFNGESVVTQDDLYDLPSATKIYSRAGNLLVYLGAGSESYAAYLYPYSVVNNTIFVTMERLMPFLIVERKNNTIIVQYNNYEGAERQVSSLLRHSKCGTYKGCNINTDGKGRYDYADINGGTLYACKVVFGANDEINYCYDCKRITFKLE